MGPEDYDPDAANPSLDLRYLLVHIQEETDSREIKGRRCCMGTEFIQFHAAL